jgi:hypothetical protein
LNRRSIADAANVDQASEKVFKKEKKDFFLFLNACFSFFEAQTEKFY